MFAPSPSISPSLSSHATTSSRRSSNQPSVIASPRLRQRPGSSPRHEERQLLFSPRSQPPRSTSRSDEQPRAVAQNLTRSPLFRPVAADARLQPASASQQPQRSIYSDAGTQYTPPGLPPTAPKHTLATLEGPGLGAVGDREAAADGRSTTVAGPSSSDEPRTSTRVAGERPGRNGLHGDAEMVGDGRGRSKTPETVLSGKRLSLVNSDDRASVKDVILNADGAHDDREDEGERRHKSPKKQRHEGPPAKVMSRDYADCDVKSLGMLVSDMLLELVRHNDALPLKDGQLTRFHSRAPPGISISDYLNRLITHASITPVLLLTMVYYIDRLCALYPIFTISSLTVHRFLITAATVAAKGLSDSFWTNNTYARVGGVTTRELALLELEFLERMDWRIVPQHEVIDGYYRSLVARGDGFVLEADGPG